MTKHICSCEICTANRALRAAIDALAWPPEHQEKLDALEAAHDAIVEKAANDEMDYVWNINRIGALFGIEHAWPDLIITKIKELQAQVDKIDAHLAAVAELRVDVDRLSQTTRLEILRGIPATVRECAVCGSTEVTQSVVEMSRVRGAYFARRGMWLMTWRCERHAVTVPQEAPTP